MKFEQDLAGWPSELKAEFKKEYFVQLCDFLTLEKRAGSLVYPKEDEIFNAFKATSFKDVKVVVLGQDPYHKKGQAHGLSFSVPKGVKSPPSLKNIYKELGAHELRPNGNLQDWADQGVFLLNSVLTVREAEAASHRGKGWEVFTDAVLKALNQNQNPIVYMLWGSYAQKKAAFLDNDNHLVLKAPHPSPLSAYRGFLGCGHFDKANKFLSEKGLKPIKWV